MLSTSKPKKIFKIHFLKNKTQIMRAPPRAGAVDCGDALDAQHLHAAQVGAEGRRRGQGPLLPRRRSDPDPPPHTHTSYLSSRNDTIFIFHHARSVSFITHDKAKARFSHVDGHTRPPAPGRLCVARVQHAPLRVFFFLLFFFGGGGGVGGRIPHNRYYGSNVLRTLSNPKSQTPKP